MSLELTQAPRTCWPSGASTRCSVPGRCAARSSARSRTSSPRRCSTARSAPARSCWSTSRARARRATFTFEGQKVGELPDLPPLETAGRTRPRRGPGRRPENDVPPRRDVHRKSPDTDRRRGRASACRRRPARLAPATVADALGDRSGQGVAAVRDRGRPGRRRAGSARRALALGLLGPGRVQPACGDAALGVAQHGQQPAAALPVGAGPGLRLAAAARRTPGGRPRATRTRSATGQARAARVARPCRPARRAPSPPPPRWRRSARRRAAASAGERRARPWSPRRPGTPRRRRRGPSTRRTLVSSTAWPPPKAKDAIALAV